MTKANKEIEYGTKVKDVQKIYAFLKQKAESSKRIEISRDIYKNGGKYFIKISREKFGTQEQFVFSLKEDLLSQGISDGMKIAEEIDISVSEEQLSALTEVVKLLGFKLTSSFSKIRTEFIVNALSITLDEYEKEVYLEIEGPTKKAVGNFVKTIPPELLKDNNN